MRLLTFAFALFCALSPVLRAQQPLVWQQRTDVGSPGLLEGTSMAFDEHQGVILLFGGARYLPGSTFSTVSDQVWQYRGTTWTQVSVSGPAPAARSGHSMVYDPVDERVLMFGGDSGGTFLGDLWAFEFTGFAAGHWVQLTSLPSAGRTNMAMGYDAGRDEFILTGGIKQGTAEVAPEIGSLYGEVKPATRETWIWNRAAWNAGPQSPSYINGPLQNYPSGNSAAPYVLGGPAGGVVAHHASTGVTLLLSERMFPVIGTPLANHFYGAGDSPPYNGISWGSNRGGVSYFDNWGALPGVAYVASPSRVTATYDPARRRVVAFGAGKTDSEEFNGAEWVSPASTFKGRFGPLPGARLHPCLAHDTARGVTVFFGGKVSLTEGGDTWELVENPAAPFAITTDLSTVPLGPCQGGSISLTGAASGVGPFKWRWYRDGSFVSITETPNLSLTNLLPVHGGLYTFEVEDSSGRQLTSSATPVEVHAPPLVTIPPLDRRVIPGESFSLLVEISSTLPVTYQWFKDSQPIPGATASIYTDLSASLADAGFYKVVATTRCFTVESTASRVMVGPTIINQPVAPAGAEVMNGSAAFTVHGDGAGSEVGTYSTGSDPTQHPNRHAPDSPTHPLPMSFTWRFEGVPISAGTKYTFNNTAVSSQLLVNDPDHEDEGFYDCVVTDASGPAFAKTTTPSLLILKPLAPPYLTLPVSGPNPGPGGGMAYDSRRARTVHFGGIPYGYNPRSTFASKVHYNSNDTWEWDGKVWLKREPAHRPPAMSGFGIAYDASRGRTVIFGGYEYQPPAYNIGSQVVSNAVWEWDGNDWSQPLAPNSSFPTARLQPNMCYDSVRQEVLMIGGSSFNPTPTTPVAGAVASNTLWAWNGAQWTQRPPLPYTLSPYPDISASYGVGFAFDAHRGKAVLFGPFYDSAYPVWEWDGAAWSRIVPPITLRVSESRQGGSAFYDPVRRRIGLPIISNNLYPNIGVSTSTLVYWNGSSFERGDTSVIDDVSGAVLSAYDSCPNLEQGDLTAFDTARRCLVWLDNLQFYYQGPATTREMHFSAKVKPVHFPAQVIYSPNQQISLRAVSAGRRGLVYQWLKNGQPVLDDARVTGADTATLTFNPVNASDIGAYSVRITNLFNQVETRALALNLQTNGVSTVVQGSGLTLFWPGTTGTLQVADDPGGPWTNVIGVTPPHTVSVEGPARFYRVAYPE